MAIERNESRINGNLVLASGRANPELAKEIAQIMHHEVVFPVVKYFADGEPDIQFPDNLRRKDVFIIQPFGPPNVAKQYMDLVLMIDAAYRASAGEITAVVPYFGFARQDEKSQPRVAISAAVAAQILEERGIDRLVTIDIHSGKQQGYIKKPWDNLRGSYVLLPQIEDLNETDLAIGSPDVGGVKRADSDAVLLKIEGGLVVVYKKRKEANKSDAMGFIGDVEGKTVVFVDDMIDTAGTLVNGAILLHEHGAKKIYAAAPHGLLTKGSLDRITDSPIEQVFITNTIKQPARVKEHAKISIINIAPLLAQAIFGIQTGESLSRLHMTTIDRDEKWREYQNLLEENGKTETP